MRDDGFERLFPELFTSARVAARAIVRRPEVAEDIAQETLTRALVRWMRIRGHARAWVTRVAINLAVDACRAEQRHPTVRVPEMRVPDSVAGVDDRIGVELALARLSRRQRQVLTCRYLLQLTDAETADALGIGTGTVKQHAARGLAALRSQSDDNRLGEGETDGIHPGAL